MKIRNLSLLGLIGLLASCSQQECKIEGTVENALDGDTLFLAQMDDEMFVPTDTIIIQDGKFSVKKKCESPKIASFFFLDKQNEMVYSNVFFIEKGTVRLDIGSEGKVSGTENNDIYQQLTDSIYALHERMAAIYEKMTQPLPEGIVPDGEYEKELVALEQQSDRLVTESVKKHISKPVGYFLLLSCYNMLTPQEVMELTEQVGEQYKSSKDIAYIKEVAGRGSQISVGQKFADITMPSIDGSELDFSEIIKNNKLTLVDCWASWCNPCRAEMPNIVALYEEYHEKGLEIIGVSFDDDEAKWKEAVTELGMTWPQASELKAWENVMTQEFGVTSIPYTILIDNGGTVLAQQLRGSDLEEVIKKRLD